MACDEISGQLPDQQLLIYQKYQRLAYTVALRILHDPRDAEEIASNAISRSSQLPKSTTAIALASKAMWRSSPAAAPGTGW